MSTTLKAITVNPKYAWFQRPAPTFEYTLGIAAVLILATVVLYRKRVAQLKRKFTEEEFTGSLKICTKISAYMDHHEQPGFAILRVCAKSFFFLGLCQWKYHVGFLLMLGLLFVESSLDALRIFLAYQNCQRLSQVQVIAQEEAHDLADTATQSKLEPTNVYEDLTRPQSIAILVFLTQVVLIGLVMDDSYIATTRTCFNGTTDVCPVLTSFGAYCLYLLGSFMACVFYVGPRNSFGKKELNPTFWLKLFLLVKEKSTQSSSSSSTTSPSVLTFTWHDAETNQERILEISKKGGITMRFVMSFLINGTGFLFLMHVLPIQVAGQANAIGVVFRAVGMIYLVDLDDTVGNTMTLVTTTSTDEQLQEQEAGSSRGFLSTIRRLRDQTFSSTNDTTSEETPLLS